jgi:hypothetical protein
VKIVVCSAERGKRAAGITTIFTTVLILITGRVERSTMLPALLRGVAQLGSVLRSGRRGRGFKSRHPDSASSTTPSCLTRYS